VSAQRPQSTSRPTLRTIAGFSGVHYSTVSRILRGDVQRTTVETRERVLKAAEELGYRPDFAARALATGRSQTLGLLVPDMRDPVFSHLHAGVERGAHELGYRVLVYPIGNDGSRFADGIENILQRGVDGIVDATAHFGADADRATRELVRNTTPYIQANRFSGELSRIAGDDVLGGRLATEHLLSLGHRRIGFIAGERVYSTTSGRLDGYREALDNAGVPYDEDLVFTRHYSLSSAASGANRLFDLENPPTAIFVGDDSLAMAVIRAAWDRGLQTPRDLSVVGYNNVLMSGVFIPSLTTIDNPLEEIGRLAVERLLGADAYAHQVIELTLPVRLVVRESSAPLRRNS
jgi:LacI family transcriptional regulator